MDDNLYPNSGDYFLPREPKDQSIARSKEKAKTLEALPVIKSVIKHLEARIAFRNTIESVDVSIADHPELHQRMMYVNSLLKQELEAEKAYLEDLLKTHAKNL